MPKSRNPSNIRSRWRLSAGALAAVVAAPAVAQPIYYQLEAETQSWSQAIIETKNSGYSGDAYINTDNVAGSWLEYSVEVPLAGTYDIDFRFANGTSFTRTADLMVNGSTQVSDAAFPGTGGWTNWQTTVYTLNLNAGSNSLRMVSTSGSGAPNYDYIGYYVQQGSNQPPEVSAPVADYSVLTGSSETLDMNTVFTDADDDALSYSLTNTNPAVVETFIDGASLSLNFLSPGTSTLSLSASDGQESTSTGFEVIVAPDQDSYSVELQAEDQSWANASVDSNHSGFTGSGFVNTENTVDTWVEFAANVPFSGSYNVTLAYANGSSARPQAVSVNGATVLSDVPFASSGAWDNWLEESFSVSLNAGDNTLRLISLSAGGAANLDRMTLVFADTPPVNQPPVLDTALPDVALSEGETSTLDLSATFSDPDGDSLFYSVSSGESSVLSVSQAGTSLNLEALAAGTATVEVSASDGEFTVSDNFTVSVLASNRPPEVIGSIADTELSQGDAPVVLNLNTIFSDPDGDPLSFSVASSVPGSPNVQLIGSSELLIDPVAEGVTSYSVVAADSSGASVGVSFDLTVLSAGGFSMELQAEDQSWASGAVETEHTGYTGGGYLNTINQQGVWVELAVTTPAAGNYAITVVYANGSSNRSQRVEVNGAEVYSVLNLDGTGAWTNYDSQTFNVNLAAGSNAVRFYSLTSGGAPNLDKFLVEGSGPTVNLGLDSRPVSSTCTVGAPPNTQELDLVTVWPDISFSLPIAMVQMPGSPNNDFYVVEKGGTIARVSADMTSSSRSTFLDLRSRVDDRSEGGILNMVFDPAYPAEPYVYVAYTYDDNGTFTTRISRFTSTNGTSAGNERVLFELPQNEAIHNGGSMAFGPDGYLYMSIGDDKRSNDVGDPNLLYGTVIRLDVHSGSTYGIPADNPFGNEVFAYGFRNPWRMSFDKLTGELWLGDVGEKCWEEINVVSLGNNYGWPNWEGDQCGLGGCAGGNTLPEFQYHQGSGCGGGSSITGGYVYRGSVISELTGKYVYGDYQTGMVWAYDPATASNQTLFSEGQSLGLASWAEDNSGELYYIDLVSSRIKRLQYNQGVATSGPATTLSGTGCFEQVGNPLLPAEGVVPYTVAQKFWSDGAEKHRYLSLPEGTSFSVDENGDWELPAGGVLIKHFTMEGAPFETRFVVRYTDGSYGTYTYEWVGSSEAVLVGAGGVDRVLANGQAWHYPSRNECFQCHTERAGFTLGLETYQLNVDNYFPSTERVANQLASLKAVGMVTGNTEPMPPFPALDNETATLDERALSYLHVNCSSCHRGSGGSQSQWDARIYTPMADKGLCNVPPITPVTGMPGEAYISPGDHSASAIWWRSHVRGDYQMPPIASLVVDQFGVDLLAEWIDAMPAGQCTSP